jgi:cytochrome b561
MPTPPRQLAALSRLLHWAMAAMVLTMLGIGMAMVVSLGDYHTLMSLHRPLGIANVVLVIIPFVKRRPNTPPPFLASMSKAERRVATASESRCTG